MSSDYKYVNYNWDDKYADTLSSRERLVYRSNILGDDQRITNTGGKYIFKADGNGPAHCRTNRSIMGKRIWW